MTHEEFERAVAELLREEAERARPDRRRPPGNARVEPDVVARVCEQLEKVLG